MNSISTTLIDFLKRYREQGGLLPPSMSNLTIAKYFFLEVEEKMYLCAQTNVALLHAYIRHSWVEIPHPQNNFKSTELFSLQELAEAVVQLLRQEQGKPEEEVEPVPETQPLVTSQDFLKACVKVQSERGGEYDRNAEQERSFDYVADMFNAAKNRKTNLVGSDIALILDCLKKVRQNANPTRIHYDSLLDSTSYTSLWAEAIVRELSEPKK